MMKERASPQPAARLRTVNDVSTTHSTPASTPSKCDSGDEGACMLSSILLRLSGDDYSAAVIRGGVEIAQRHGARIRGLTIVDTRRIVQLRECETAAYAVFEHSKLERSRNDQASAQAQLTRACLDAGVNFDVRRMTGDP